MSVRNKTAIELIIFEQVVLLFSRRRKIPMYQNGKADPVWISILTPSPRLLKSAGHEYRNPRTRTWNLKALLHTPRRSVLNFYDRQNRFDSHDCGICPKKEGPTTFPIYQSSLFHLGALGKEKKSPLKFNLLSTKARTRWINIYLMLVVQ